MSRPPLKDVAELAGVSEPTVSRVLNGRTNVAEATRQRVTAVLRQLGYAESVEPRPERRNVVGIVAGEFLNPVFPTMVEYISHELAQRGFLSIVTIADQHINTEERCVRELVDIGVDGAVFIVGRHAEVGSDLSHYRDLTRQGIPIVLVNGGDTGLDVPHVYCDEEAGAHKAVTHLIEMGHTRVGCVLGSDHFVPTARMIAGFRLAFADAGLDEPDDPIVHAAFTLEGGRVGALKLFDAGFTAILAGNDLMALGAVRASATRGHVDAALSVVGYDGTDFTAFTSPGLTTLRQPFTDMAAHVAEAMVSEIDGSRRFRDHYVFVPELVLRESTSAVARLQSTGTG